MPRALFLLAAVALCHGGPRILAQQETGPSREEAGFEASSRQHMRDELGVNDMTAPSIAGILRDLSNFQPVPIEVINQNNREAAYQNRMQTALHFGSLVADGFMLTIAERPQDIQDVGKALIRQSRALGVGDRLTKRSQSLFDLSDRGDWARMREELIRTQGDVEQSMMDLRDEEMAHMVSLGGWLRGFQLAAHNTQTHFTPDKAALLARTDILDYFLDRLSTLHPRLKKTQFATELTARVTEIKALAEEAGATHPTPEQVARMTRLADRAVAIALGPVDAGGRILPK